jgi:FMN-dependent NADH-azoreductase
LGADLSKGGAYLQELFDADILVIGAPMYNFSVIGLTDITVVRAEGLGFGPEAREAAMQKARKRIQAIAA